MGNIGLGCSSLSFLIFPTFKIFWYVDNSWLTSVNLMNLEYILKLQIILIILKRKKRYSPLFYGIEHQLSNSQISSWMVNNVSPSSLVLAEEQVENSKRWQSREKGATTWIGFRFSSFVPSPAFQFLDNRLGLPTSPLTDYCCRLKILAKPIFSIYYRNRSVGDMDILAMIFSTKFHSFFYLFPKTVVYGINLWD